MMDWCDLDKGKGFVSVFGMFLLGGSLFFSGCMMAQPEKNNALVVQNNARFLHAYKDARVDLSQNQFSKAEAIDQAWKKYPYLTPTHQRLLLGLDQQIRRDEAIYRMGEARQLERVGHLNEALSKVSQAARLDPSWVIPKQARSHLLILIEVQNQMGRQWESLSARLLLLRKEGPANPELDRTLSWAYRHLAQTRLSSNHLPGAYRSVKRALLLDPSDNDAIELKKRILEQVNAHIAHGEAYFRSNQIRKAVKSFREALLIRPSDPRAQKDLDMALEAQALGNTPRHPSSSPQSSGPRL